ncbi:hypothetical protein J8281_11645 [Aquimarina sp. U1-2]|uniref:hypothetical protein n=1 Tax=Aquimarina sp. U1-2 TaxID=2823141 RepID=UPI001AEC8665|nr:hypothetical protein [Aquimarina sp. U1-2]MBP2832840.1 hypothetical protein [Aquimarina sp. U1-2]
MKNKITYIITLVIGMFIANVNAQNEDVLEFEVYDQIEDSFKIALRINSEAVQFIQFDFYEENHLVFNQEAILNKKLDGNYYFSFNGSEKEVFLDDIRIETQVRSVKAKPKSKSLEVKVLDKNFNIIAKNRKQI